MFFNFYFINFFQKTLLSPSKWPILTEKLKKISCRKCRSLGKKSVRISGALNVGILEASSVGQIGAPLSIYPSYASEFFYPLVCTYTSQGLHIAVKPLSKTYYVL